jgi:hypothetical protein
MMIEMKGNDGKGNIPERDEWETPPKLFNILNNQYKFTIDCCANKYNSKLSSYSDNFENVHHVNVGWMNPPFSKARLMFEHFFKVTESGVAIYRCDNLETKIWQDVILQHANWIFIPKGRISYKGLKGSGSRFPSALIGVNIKPPENINGKLLIVNK